MATGFPRSVRVLQIGEDGSPAHQGLLVVEVGTRLVFKMRPSRHVDINTLAIWTNCPADEDDAFDRRVFSCLDRKAIQTSSIDNDWFTFIDIYQPGSFEFFAEFDKVTIFASESSYESTSRREYLMKSSLSSDSEISIGDSVGQSHSNRLGSTKIDRVVVEAPLSTRRGPICRFIVQPELTIHLLRPVESPPFGNEGVDLFHSSVVDAKTDEKLGTGTAVNAGQNPGQSSSFRTDTPSSQLNGKFESEVMTPSAAPLSSSLVCDFAEGAALLPGLSLKEMSRGVFEEVLVPLALEGITLQTQLTRCLGPIDSWLRYVPLESALEAAEFGSPGAIPNLCGSEGCVNSLLSVNEPYFDEVCTPRAVVGTLAEPLALKYNFLHFTPIQKLGNSGSCYSIDDQLSLASSIFLGNAAVVNALLKAVEESPWAKPELLKKLPESEQLMRVQKLWSHPLVEGAKMAVFEAMVGALELHHGTLSMVDVVLNHTSADSEFLKVHPEAGYSLQNSPHLRAAFELDEAVLSVSEAIRTGHPAIDSYDRSYLRPSPQICDEAVLSSNIHFLFTNEEIGVPAVRLHEFFEMDPWGVLSLAVGSIPSLQVVKSEAEVFAVSSSPRPGGTSFSAVEEGTGPVSAPFSAPLRPPLRLCTAGVSPPPLSVVRRLQLLMGLDSSVRVLLCLFQRALDRWRGRLDAAESPFRSVSEAVVSSAQLRGLAALLMAPPPPIPPKEAVRRLKRAYDPSHQERCTCGGASPSHHHYHRHSRAADQRESDPTSSPGPTPDSTSFGSPGSDVRQPSDTFSSPEGCNCTPVCTPLGTCTVAHSHPAHTKNAFPVAGTRIGESHFGYDPFYCAVDPTDLFVQPKTIPADTNPSPHLPGTTTITETCPICLNGPCQVSTTSSSFYTNVGSESSFGSERQPPNYNSDAAAQNNAGTGAKRAEPPPIRWKCSCTPNAKSWVESYLSCMYRDSWAVGESIGHYPPFSISSDEALRIMNSSAAASSVLAGAVFADGTGGRFSTQMDVWRAFAALERQFHVIVRPQEWNFNPSIFEGGAKTENMENPLEGMSEQKLETMEAAGFHTTSGLGLGLFPALLLLQRLVEEINRQQAERCALVLREARNNIHSAARTLWLQEAGGKGSLTPFKGLNWSYFVRVTDDSPRDFKDDGSISKEEEERPYPVHVLACNGFIWGSNTPQFDFTLPHDAKELYAAYVREGTAEIKYVKKTPRPSGPEVPPDAVPEVSVDENSTSPRDDKKFEKAHFLGAHLLEVPPEQLATSRSLFSAGQWSALHELEAQMSSDWRWPGSVTLVKSSSPSSAAFTASSSSNSDSNGAHPTSSSAFDGYDKLKQENGSENTSSPLRAKEGEPTKEDTKHTRKYAETLHLRPDVMTPPLNSALTDYLTRSIIVWGDCVKLRYGLVPADSPWLWQRMGAYVRRMAHLFHGLRIDNAHGTPLHVAAAMADAARDVRASVYINAELFTQNLALDVEFITRIGITSLVREFMQLSSSQQLAGSLNGFGSGRPLGTLQPPFRQGSTAARIETLVRERAKIRSAELAASSSASGRKEDRPQLEDENIYRFTHRLLKSGSHYDTASLSSAGGPSLRRRFSLNGIFAGFDMRALRSADRPIKGPEAALSSRFHSHGLSFSTPHKAGKRVYSRSGSVGNFQELLPPQSSVDFDSGFVPRAASAQHISVNSNPEITPGSYFSKGSPPATFTDSESMGGRPHRRSHEDLTTEAQKWDLSQNDFFLGHSADLSRSSSYSTIHGTRSRSGSNSDAHYATLSAGVARVMPSSLQPLIFDCTHDNEPPARHLTPELASSFIAAATMAVSAVGSTRGFDILVPRNVSVVRDHRLFADHPSSLLPLLRSWHIMSGIAAELLRGETPVKRDWNIRLEDMLQEHYPDFPLLCKMYNDVRDALLRRQAHAHHPPHGVRYLPRPEGAQNYVLSVEELRDNLRDRAEFLGHPFVYCPDLGVRRIRRRTNVLKQELAARGHNQIFSECMPVPSGPTSDELSSSVVAITRAHPDQRSSYVMLTRTAFRKSAVLDAKAHKRGLVPVRISGRVVGVVLAAMLTVTQDDRGVGKNPSGPIFPPADSVKELLHHCEVEVPEVGSGSQSMRILGNTLDRSRIAAKLSLDRNWPLLRMEKLVFAASSTSREITLKTFLKSHESQIRSDPEVAEEDALKFSSNVFMPHLTLLNGLSSTLEYCDDSVACLSRSPTRDDLTRAALGMAYFDTVEQPWAGIHTQVDTVGTSIDRLSEGSGSSEHMDAMVRGDLREDPMERFTTTVWLEPEKFLPGAVLVLKVLAPHAGTEPGSWDPLSFAAIPALLSSALGNHESGDLSHLDRLTNPVHTDWLSLNLPVPRATAAFDLHKDGSPESPRTPENLHNHEPYSSSNDGSKSQQETKGSPSRETNSSKSPASSSSKAVATVGNGGKMNWGVYSRKGLNHSFYFDLKLSSLPVPSLPHAAYSLLRLLNDRNLSLYHLQYAIFTTTAEEALLSSQDPYLVPGLGPLFFAGPAGTWPLMRLLGETGVMDGALMDHLRQGAWLVRSWADRLMVGRVSHLLEGEIGNVPFGRFSDYFFEALMGTNALLDVRPVEPGRTARTNPLVGIQHWLSAAADAAERTSSFLRPLFVDRVCSCFIGCTVSAILARMRGALVPSPGAAISRFVLDANSVAGIRSAQDFASLYANRLFSHTRSASAPGASSGWRKYRRYRSRSGLANESASYLRSLLTRQITPVFSSRVALDGDVESETPSMDEDAYWADARSQLAHCVAEHDPFSPYPLVTMLLMSATSLVGIVPDAPTLRRRLILQPVVVSVVKEDGTRSSAAGNEQFRKKEDRGNSERKGEGSDVELQANGNFDRNEAMPAITTAADINTPSICLLRSVPFSVAAGFTHFSTGFMRSWGRDTFISLRGLLMVPGRFGAARDIILGFAAVMRHGLLPNLMDGGARCRFNSRDSVWWWIMAIAEYVRLSPEGARILGCRVFRRFPSDYIDHYHGDDEWSGWKEYLKELNNSAPAVLLRPRPCDYSDHVRRIDAFNMEINPTLSAASSSSGGVRRSEPVDTFEYELFSGNTDVFVDETRLPKPFLLHQLKHGECASPNVVGVDINVELIQPSSNISGSSGTNNSKGSFVVGAFRAPPICTLGELVAEALTRHAETITFREWRAGHFIDEHMRTEGFDHRIYVEPSSGLVHGGSRYNCGTWMDKMGSHWSNKGEPATPRDGAAIEISALLYYALKFISSISEDPAAQSFFPLAGAVLSTGEALTWAAWRDRVRSSLFMRYYVPTDPKDDARFMVNTSLVNKRDILRDTVDPEIEWTAYHLRPNLLVALTLAPEAFDPEVARNILCNVERFLLNSPLQLGIKTLSYDDLAYRPDYDNSDNGSDKHTAAGWNYHQGPEWLWLYGYYLRARINFPPLVPATVSNSTVPDADPDRPNLHINVPRSEPIAGEALKQWVFARLSHHRKHLEVTPDWGLPELTNSNGTFCRDSCSAQAWSVATILDALYDLKMVAP